MDFVSSMMMMMMMTRDGKERKGLKGKGKEKEKRLRCEEGMAWRMGRMGITESCICVSRCALVIINQSINQIKSIMRSERERKKKQGLAPTCLSFPASV